MSSTVMPAPGHVASASGPARRGQRQRVLVTRAREQGDGIVDALRAVGLEPVLVPAIAIDTPDAPAVLERAAARLSSYRWLVASSANGVAALIAAADRMGADPRAAAWAVIGPATRAALAQRGCVAAFQPSEPSAKGLAVELPIEPGERVLVVRGDLATDRLASSLAARGADVEDVVGYRTVEAPVGSRDLLRSALAAGPLAGVVFTSGSTVRGLDALAAAEGFDLSRIPAICIGESTAKVARAAGHDVIAIAPTPEAEVLATCAAAALAEARDARA